MKYGYLPGLSAVVLVSGLLVVRPPGAGAVSCPGSPSTAQPQICVTNTTTSSPTITLSGSVLGSAVTCTGASGTYSRSVVLPAGVGSRQCWPVPQSGNLVAGMWAHKISAGAMPAQNQYQKGPVLYTAPPPGYSGIQAKVEWTYFPPANVVTVNVTGDAGTGSCTTSCTFRQAIARANSLSASGPVLIQFSVSPGNMTQSADIVLAGSGKITIDGTNSNGEPWIVGDANAAAAGTQGPFPRVVDLRKATRIRIDSSNNTIQGLDIQNTLAGVEQNRTLIAHSQNGGEPR